MISPLDAISSYLFLIFYWFHLYFLRNRKDRPSGRTYSSGPTAERAKHTVPNRLSRRDLEVNSTDYSSEALPPDCPTNGTWMNLACVRASCIVWPIYARRQGATPSKRSTVQDTPRRRVPLSASAPQRPTPHASRLSRHAGS